MIFVSLMNAEEYNPEMFSPKREECGKALGVASLLLHVPKHQGAHSEDEAAVELLQERLNINYWFL